MKEKVVGYPITSLEKLEELCKGRHELDCYVRLNCRRSSKHLTIEEDGSVTVFNEIDDSSESFESLKDMMENHSLIKEAVEKNAFFVYAYEIHRIEEENCLLRICVL